MQEKPWFTFVLPVDPDNIRDDNSYVVHCPKGTLPLGVKQHQNYVYIVVQAPVIIPPDSPPDSFFRLFIYPGRDTAREHRADTRYIGTAVIFEDNNMQDWHIYYDTSGATVTGDPQATIH